MATVWFSGFSTLFLNISARAARAFFLPRSLETNEIFAGEPLSALKMGLIFKSVPAIARVAEILPPFLRYFKSATVK